MTAQERTINIQLGEDKETATRIEGHVKALGFKYSRKGNAREPYLIVETPDAQQAFYLGMNVAAIGNKLFDSGITRTGRG